MMPSQQQSSRTPRSKRDNYRTPKVIYQWAEYYFGKFDIDLAASHDNTLCDKYFSLQDNALYKSWSRHGKKGWCNPPYSNIDPWILHAIVEMENNFETVFLIPTPNGEGRDTLLFRYASQIVFITGWYDGNRGRSGRIPFTDYDGIPTKFNMRGSCLVQFTPYIDQVELSDQGPRKGPLVHWISWREIQQVGQKLLFENGV